LTAWAAVLLGVLRRHRWVRELPISGPPMGPGNLAWLDRALAALEDTGLDEGRSSPSSWVCCRWCTARRG
jgi:hypothetical protein